MPNRLRSFLPWAAFLAAVCALGSDQFQVIQKIPVEGAGGWDYLAVDSQNRRLYVSHGTKVDVLNLDTRKIAGKIDGLKGVHGIAIANDLGKGFITSGGDSTVVIFDLKTLKTLGSVKTGTNPDGVVYEPKSKRVLSFNGRSNDATVIDAVAGKSVGTIALGGRPEFPAADGRGNVYANIEDKSEIVHIDPVKMEVKARWPILPCEGPSGLAMDTAARRLFAVCDKTMAVVNADTGKLVTTVPIGDGPDAVVYDAGIKTIFSSNGEGTITVVRQESADHYKVEYTAKTQPGARTLALDPKTHTLYLSVADLGPAPAATAENPHPRRPIVPGTFKLLVVAR